MGEDPKEVFKRMGVKTDQEAVDALKAYPSKTCVFCAEPQQDCNPLFRLRADLFIYAGAASDFDSLWKQIPRPVEQTSVGQALTFLGCYMCGENDPSALVQNPDVIQLLQLIEGEKPEVRLIKLRRTVGEERREFWVLGVGLDAHRVYGTLFAARNLAPNYLCLFPENDNSWHGKLAALVQANAAAEPEFVISNDVGYNWPWAQPWQAFNSWQGTVMYALRDRTPERICAAGRAGSRTVRVRNAALTPETIGDARAAYISVATHQQFHWPGHVKLLVQAPEEYAPDPRTARLNPHFDTLDLSGLPLGTALARLQRRCQGAEKIATVRLGFEDEGPELDQWRRQPGAPLELTIYCEHGGDVASFGPHADVIQ